MTDFEKIHSFESLYNAYRKARQGKRWKGAAAKFEVNLLEALNLLSAQIRTKRYTMSPYNTFEVYEPKRRVVMSNSYKDKVVQHSLCDTVCAIVFGYIAFVRNRDKDKESNVKHDATVLTEIGYIKANTDEIKAEQKEQRKTNTEFVTRLTDVEASAKQAHKRLDHIEKRMDQAE